MTKPDTMFSYNGIPEKWGTIIKINIDSAVLLLTSETSDKYAPLPSKPSSLANRSSFGTQTLQEFNQMEISISYIEQKD